MSNEVPQLFDWDQEKNQPADRWGRLELNYSCVEFVAPVEYMVRRSVHARACGLGGSELAPSGSASSAASVRVPDRRLPRCCTVRYEYIGI